MSTFEEPPLSFADVFIKQWFPGKPGSIGYDAIVGVYKCKWPCVLPPVEFP